MEAKVFGMLAVFALIVAGAGWMLNITSTNELDSKITEAKSGLRGVTSNLERLADSFDTITRSKIRLNELAQKQAGLEKKLLDVRQQTASSNVEAADLENRYQTLVAEVRQAAAGVLLPSIQLKSGKVLTGARIEHATADVLSVTYAEGTAHLLKKDLPDDLVSRFQMTDPVPGAPPPLPKPKDPYAENPAKIKELNDNLAVLNSKLTVAQGNLVLWQKKEMEYKARYYNARAAGRSSSIVSLTEAETAVTAASQQVLTLRAQANLVEHALQVLNAQH